jgi:hypothetical protein
VNGDVVPALIAAGSGSVLVAGIWGYEHRRDEAMRSSRVRLSMRFPFGVDSVHAKAALSGLSGLSPDVELVVEVAADVSGIGHFLWVPAAVQKSVAAVLSGVMPGLRLAEAPTLQGRATLAGWPHLMPVSRSCCGWLFVRADRGRRACLSRWIEPQERLSASGAPRRPCPASK